MFLTVLVTTGTRERRFSKLKIIEKLSEVNNRSKSFHQYGYIINNKKKKDTVKTI